MSIKYQGLSGTEYYAEKEIAHGGEGIVFSMAGNEEQVIKIFKPERRTEERKEKLLHMVENKLTAEELEQITWPQDVVFADGEFVGYVMPRLKYTDSLVAVYSSGNGGVYDLPYRMLTAINLCHAVKTVHDMGQVCGDLNPQNICVNLNKEDKAKGFQVTLVDADSYHYTTKEGKTYRCEVGLSDYIAPEVQEKMTGGMDLKSASLPTYTKETDLFALAVHIFTLLMNGCHPFACAKDLGENRVQHTMQQMNSSETRDSVVAPQPIENIKNGFFPFNKNKPGITYPIYAPSFESLPQKLRALFVKTFEYGYEEPTQRVDTQEWIDALTEAFSSIVPCEKNATHFYFNHVVSCPLCAVNIRMRNVIEVTKQMDLGSSSTSTATGQTAKPKQVTPVQGGNATGGVGNQSQGQSAISVREAELKKAKNRDIRRSVIAEIIWLVLMVPATIGWWHRDSGDMSIFLISMIYSMFVLEMIHLNKKTVWFLVIVMPIYSMYTKGVISIHMGAAFILSLLENWKTGIYCLDELERCVYEFEFMRTFVIILIPSILRLIKLIKKYPQT